MKTSVSLMCVDILDMAEEIRRIETCGVDSLHYDLIDGVFSDNLGLSLGGLSRTVEHTWLPVDVHCMLNHPLNLLGRIEASGARNIIIHSDTVCWRVLDYIYARREFVNFGLAVTAIDATTMAILQAIRPWKVVAMTVRPGHAGAPFVEDSPALVSGLRSLRSTSGLRFLIEVDGAVGPLTIDGLASAGADSCVIGSTIMRNGRVLPEEIITFRNEFCRS